MNSQMSIYKFPLAAHSLATPLQPTFSSRRRNHYMRPPDLMPYAVCNRRAHFAQAAASPSAGLNHFVIADNALILEALRHEILRTWGTPRFCSLSLV